MERTAGEYNLVLEAIDKIAAGRSRPNLPRIARYLLRLYSIPSQRTIELLEVLLSHDRVKEVIYKGSISYRNPTRWRRTSSYSSARAEMNPSSSVVFKVFHQLYLGNVELKATGISESQLHAALSEKLSADVTGGDIKRLILKELDADTIFKNHLGNFVMNPHITEEILMLDDSSSDSDCPETKETDSTTTERTIDSLDISSQDLPKSEETSCKIDKDVESDKAYRNSPSPERVDESIEPIPAEVLPKIRRRSRKKQILELDVPEKSPSPDRTEEAAEDKASLLVITSKNSGRRIIRKMKTKYDPSEYFLTPLVRKKKESVVPKPRAKRGRYITAKAIELQKQKGAKPIVISADTETVVTATEPASPVQTRNVELQVREKATMLTNLCYLCSTFADIIKEQSTFSCSLCLNIAHKDCIANDGFFKELKKWRCEECLASNPVVCSSCEQEYNKKGCTMLMCDFCEEFFHVDCHKPPVKLPLQDTTWRCSFCPKLTISDTLIGGREDLKSTVGTFAFCPTSALQTTIKTEPIEETDFSELAESIKEPPPSEEPMITKIKIEPPDVEEEIEEKIIPRFKLHRPDELIPTVDSWTTKQVSEYFTEKFGCVVGNAFLSQEIDGKALKLMSRHNVTDELGLNFGIALKVLYYVKKIQLGTNELHKLWA